MPTGSATYAAARGGGGLQPELLAHPRWPFADELGKLLTAWWYTRSSSSSSRSDWSSNPRCTNAWPPDATAVVDCRQRARNEATMCRAANANTNANTNINANTSSCRIDGGGGGVRGGAACVER